MSMFSKLKQFKDLRAKAKTIQNTLASEKAEGNAGWGKVKITMDGNQKILGVAIAPEAMADKTKLEEMVREAGNDAIQKIQRIMSTKLRETGGLDLANEFGEAFKK